MHKVVFQLDIKKFLKRISARDATSIISMIESLAKDPRPNGVQKLKGRAGYRARTGSYRIIYTVDDGELIVCIIDAGHRKDIYR